MIEVYVKSGVCYDIDMKYDKMLAILQDEFIHQNTYITAKLPDGLRCAIRKDCIVSINEIPDNQNA